MELEARLAALSPEKRAEVSDAYRSLIRGVTASTNVISGHFRPSKIATLGLLTALLGAMGPGGGEKLLGELRQLAQKTGPHVIAFVQAL